MSSRQLRKLQQQKELEAARRAEEEAQAQSDESEDEPINLPSNSKASLFANLADLDDEDAEEGEVEDNVSLSEPEPSSKPAPKAKKSKKKKKKGKKSKDVMVAEKEDTQDIDAALKELDLQQPNAGGSHISGPKFDPTYEKICELVKIQTQHLKVANEMKNLFGRAAIENHDDAGGPVGRGGRRQPRAQRQQIDLETALKGQHAPGKGLPEITLRRNLFIQGKDDWPRGTTGGLTMQMIDDARAIDGTVEFRFVHDKTYQTVQQVFTQLVEVGDPQNLIGFLTKNPYHISSLLQVSKIAKDQTDHALSSDLLERALFSFNRASLSLFNTKIAEGKARLDFTRPENRELWLAGYHYIKSLIMKGTYRTAFEWAKLLFSLDPEEDPYSMRLMLHHLALRAHQFKWLLEFGEVDASTHTPEGEESDEHLSLLEFHNAPSLALAALQLGDGVKAREILTESMRKIPWLFTSLFSELNLDSPPSIWGSQPRTDAENLFTSLYVRQTKDLWNTTEATALLMEIAHTISKDNLQPITPVSNSSMTIDIVRFVYLDNTPALMALVPSHLLHGSNNSDSDPLPPFQSTLSYQVHHENLPDGMRGDGLGMNDPLAAMQRLLQGLARPDFDDHEGPEPELDDDAFTDDEDEENPSSEPLGYWARFVNYLNGSGPRPSWARDEDEEDDEDTDTDNEEMPGLVPLDARFGHGHGQERQDPGTDVDTDAE